MPNDVRIGYQIDVSGVSDFKSLTEAIRGAIEQQKAFEQQSNQAGESAEKASQIIAQLVGFYDKLKAAGQNSSTPLPTEKLEEGKKLLGDVLGQLESIRKENFAPAFDDSGLKRGADSAKGLQKQFADLAAEIDRINTKSVLNVVPDKGIASGVRALKLQEHIDSFSGAIPEEKLDDLSGRVTQVVHRDVFAEQLKSANSGPENAVAESLAREQGGEQAVLALRLKNIEAVRAQALAETQVAAEVDLINGAVGRQIKLEQDTAGLKQRLQQEQELFTAKERVAKLVEETNQRELSGIEKINARRNQFQAQYGKSPELRQQINSSFDKQVQQEQEKPTGGRGIIQNAYFATQAPGFAAANALGDFAEKLGPIGIGAGVTAVAVAGVAKAMYSLVESEGKAAEGLQNFASRLGLTVNQASQLSAEAAIAGVNIQSLEGAARYLSQALEDPAGAGKKSAAALREMGVASYTAAGQERELGQVTLDVIEKLSHYPTAAERAFHATQLLGRGGAKELQPLIEQHQELKKVAEDLGYGNVEELTKKLGEADDEFDKLHLSVKLLAKELAGLAAPIVIPVIQRTTQFVSGLSNGKNQKDDQAAQQAYLDREALAQQNDTSNALQEPLRLTDGQLRAALPKPTLSPDASSELARITGSDNATKAAARADADRERKALLDTRDGLEARKAELNKQIQTNEAKLVSPEITIGRDDLHASVTNDRAELAKVEARLKQLSASGRTENRYQSELDRINEELVKAEHPVSEFGRAPEIEAQFHKQVDSYRRDFAGKERDTLIARATEAKDKSVASATSEFAGNQALKSYQETHINTDARLESTRLQEETSQRLAEINSPEKTETVDAVNQAYGKQLDLAKQIHDANLADLATLRQKLALAGDHTHDGEVSKLQADEDRKYDAAKAKADSERAIRTAQIQKQERDEAKKTADTLARIQEETQNHGFQLQIDHAQRLAEIRRPDTESPVSSVNSALESQKQLARLEYDNAVATNQLELKGGELLIANEKARQRLREDGWKAELEAEEKIASLKKQESDEAKDSARSLYQALRSGPRGIQEFFRRQADQVGENLFAQIVGPIIQKADQTINPSGGGIIGAATKGTIFGASNGSSQQQPGQPNTQQQPGFLNKLQQSLGLKPPAQPISTPPTTEPLIGSLERNKGSLDALTAAILGITPGGGVGPNPLAQNPLGAAAVPQQEAAPGFSELGITSLIRSTQQTQTAVQSLAETHQAKTPLLSPESETVDGLPSEPISVAPLEEQESSHEPITAPVVTPHVHVSAPSPVVIPAPHVSPLIRVHSPVTVERGSEFRAPLAAPVPTSPSGFPVLADVSGNSAAQAAQGPPAPQTSEPASLADQAPSLSPSGFPILGEVASSDPNSLQGLFSEAAKSAVAAINPLPAIKRYAYDIPGEELGKASDAFGKGNYLESAGHVLASIPGTGLVSDTLTAQMQLGQRAAKEFQDGQYGDALAHELTAVVPVIGPQSAAMADKLRSGDPKQIAQAVGEFGGIAAAGALPLHKLPEAAGKLSDLAKAAGDDPVVQALKDETGSVGPGAGRKPTFQKWLEQQYPLPPQSKIPEAGNVPYLLTDDGGIYAGNESDYSHIKLAERLGIPPARITKGGFLQDGVDEDASATSANITRWTGQEKAKARLAFNKIRAAKPNDAAPAPDFIDRQGWFTSKGKFIPASDSYEHAALAKSNKLGKSADDAIAKGNVRISGSRPEYMGLQGSYDHIDKVQSALDSLAFPDDNPLTVELGDKESDYFIGTIKEAKQWVKAQALLQDAKTADQSLSTAAPKKSPHGFATLGDVSSIGSLDGLFAAQDTTPAPPVQQAASPVTVPPQTSSTPAPSVVTVPVSQPNRQPASTATAPYKPSAANLLGLLTGPANSIYEAPPGTLPTSTPGVFRIGGFAGDIYVDRNGRPLSAGGSAAPTPTTAGSTPTGPVIPPAAPASQISPFAKAHPALAKTGDTATQLLVASLPGAVTRNPTAIATSAFSDVGILLHALDTRKATKAGSDTFGGSFLNGLEHLFGVATPQQRYQQQQARSTGIPSGPRTPPFLPGGIIGVGSQNGQLPTAGGQSIPGTDANSGTVLTRLPSGLILRQPSASSPLGGLDPDGITMHLDDSYSRQGESIGTPGLPSAERRTLSEESLRSIANVPEAALPWWALPRPVQPSRPRSTYSSLPSRPGLEPVFPDQSVSGTQDNAGYRLTRLESGLIQRQIASADSTITYGTPGDVPASSLPPDPGNVFGLPQPPPFPAASDNPFLIPTAPSFEDHLPLSGDPNVQLVNPNANADATHAAVLNNGLSRTAPFNAGGAQILPTSVLDAATPFHSPSSAFAAVKKAGQSVLAGFGASGLAGFGGGAEGGSEEPSGFETTSTISFGDGTSTSFDGGGSFAPGVLTQEDNGNLGDFSNSELGQLDNSEQGTLPDLGMGKISDMLSPSSKGSGFQLPGIGAFLGSGLGIYGGLKQGGAKGHAGALSSGLGLAAQLDPEPISKTILGIAAAVSGVISALMGDPRAKREKQLAKAVEGQKIAAFPFTQPGIELDESAAGGHAVTEAYNGALQVSAGKPIIYTRNEAAGFDVTHPDRIISRPVREVTTMGDVDGNSPVTIIPTTPASALIGSSGSLPVSSADLTTPQLPLSSTDLTPNPVQSETATNPLAALAAMQSQITNHYGGNQISVQVPPHLFDNSVISRYAGAIADAVDQKLRTSTHPLAQTVRDTVRTS